MSEWHTVQSSRPGSSRFVIRLFGPLTVEGQGRTLGPGNLGGRRPKQVLEILLAARGRPVPTDRIADLLWGRTPPRNAAGSIQTFVSVLRRRLTRDGALARELVVTETEAYRYATSEIELDLDRFDELHDRSAREPTQLARRSLEKALALVRGEVLEDEPYAVWAQELRRAYEGRVLNARLEAADAALAELDYAAALGHAQAAAALDRFGDRAQRTQMVALYALGRQNEALETYRRFRACLDEELGLGPAAETRALESAILRQDDLRSLLPPPRTRAAAVDTGARPIRLLGRAQELAMLEHAVRQSLDGSFALLQIVGEEGMGKTRLLGELANGLVDVRVGRASCSRLEQHLPYVPIAAALRDALRDVELDRRLPALRRILPELGLGEPAKELAEIHALEALVELVAEQAPLVLLLDDLHWADPHTVAAASYLQRRGDDMPAAIVTTVRSEQTSPTHLAHHLRPDLLVRLDPLTAAELAPLGIPDLEEATGGNPRFLAAAVASGDRREPSPALAEMLRAQCRAEGAFAYRVLLAASVLEQPFGLEPLAILLGAEQGELAEELERLCERRILRVEGPRFHFRHQLMREVLRAGLSPARRRLFRLRLDDTAELGSTSTGRVAQLATG